MAEYEANSTSRSWRCWAQLLTDENHSGPHGAAPEKARANLIRLWRLQATRAAVISRVIEMSRYRIR